MASPACTGQQGHGHRRPRDRRHRCRRSCERAGPGRHPLARGARGLHGPLVIGRKVSEARAEVARGGAAGGNRRLLAAGRHRGCQRQVRELPAGSGAAGRAGRPRGYGRRRGGAGGRTASVTQALGSAGPAANAGCQACGPRPCGCLHEALGPGQELRHAAALAARVDSARGLHWLRSSGGNAQCGGEAACLRALEAARARHSLPAAVCAGREGARAIERAQTFR
mmetsp:Transcript_100608/g.312903  ORF Transcript_100608/g.312903 Transcript_100608/m.312903 type:complete len:225 (+) Transcript_100608:217-891(+)